MKKRSLFLLPLCLFMLSSCTFPGGGGDEPIVDPATTLARIEVSSKPNKVTYEVDEEFDPTGLVVKAVYLDEKKVEITSYTLSSVDMSTPGNKTITVTYEGKTTSFRIEVLSPGDQLDAPTLKVNFLQNGLIWDDIKDATGYSIEVNDEKPYIINESKLSFDNIAGEYVIKITALAHLEKYNSEPAVFEFTAIETSMGELSRVGDDIVWADSVALKVEYKIGSGAFVAAEGEKVAIQDTGLYTFHAKNGFDEENKIYYFDGENSYKVYDIPEPYLERLIIADGTEETDNDLNDKFIGMKYGDGGWAVNANIGLFLDTSNDGFSDGKCIKMQYLKHSADFKFENKNVKFQNFNNVSFILKGTDDINEKFKIQFMINKSTYISGLDISGVYATYTISNVSQGWTKYVINVDDPNWSISIGGSKYKPADAVSYFQQIGQQVESFADLLPYFDTFSFLGWCTANASWGRSYFWFDDVELNRNGLETSSTPMIAVRKNYACVSDAFEGRLNKNVNDNTWALSYVDGDEQVSLPVEVEAIGEKLHITCEVYGKEFDALLATPDSGISFTLESVTGNGASLLTNLQAEVYNVIEDFESYEETGIGFDSTHSADEISGLRAAFYCDYYNGGSGSPLGGNGWSLMGSTNYLNLNQDPANAHTGNQSAQFKYNKDADCRYHTYGLYDGTATAYPNASTFSFWTKGTGDRDNTLVVRVYSVNQVNAGNQSTAANFVRQEFFIPMDSDWVECKVTLDVNKSYYGFSINPSKYHGEGGVFFYVDDVTVYNNISPWGN